MRIEDQSDYHAAFPKKVRSDAHKLALDIRKFEIELYWKRATYFWTLIAATFAGYFSLASIASPRPLLVFAVNCLGLVLSLAWFLANRGSKYWQENWERHVDALEEGFVGPLYKTTISTSDFSLFNLLQGYPYSVSKVNQLVSLYVVSIWIILALSNILSSNAFWLIDNVMGMIGGLTIFFVLLLLWKGRSGDSDTRRRLLFNISRIDGESV